VSGEREGDRDVMSRNTRDLMDAGIKREKAEKMARESMLRVDRKMREEGKR